jgi:hypothetical protein
MDSDELLKEAEVRIFFHLLTLIVTGRILIHSNNSVLWQNSKRSNHSHSFRLLAFSAIYLPCIISQTSIIVAC